MTNAQRKQEIEGKLAVLVEAYAGGQIKIYKAAKYQGKHPENGYSFYRIKYISQNKIVYDGAYILKKEAEQKLAENGNINKFILIQLATQL